MRSYLLSIASAITLLAGIASAQASTYAIDPAHTYATFEIAHFGWHFHQPGAF